MEWYFHCAADGAEAIELLKHHQYSVILLDLMMPRVDGFGVIDYLKRHAQNPKPIVLVITAYADQKFKEVDPTIVAGVQRKPFEVAELGGLVRLCATGFHREVSEKLLCRTIARFAISQGSTQSRRATRARTDAATPQRSVILSAAKDRARTSS